MERGRSNGYGQYCPVVRAVEVIGERWSLLIVRDLVTGTNRFNDLARGLPGLSRSLLAKRLRALQAAGVVTKEGDTYVLTEAGRDLEPILFALGGWGARWSFGPPRDDERDPELLLWWAHNRIDVAALPPRRVVLAFVLSQPSFRGWLVVDRDGVSVCKADPGFPIDVTVTAPYPVLAEVWLGRRTLLDAVRAGDLDLDGPRDLVRRLPQALQLSPMAVVVRGASAPA